MLDRFADFYVFEPGHIWAVAALLGLLFVVAAAAQTRYRQIRSLPLFIAFLLWLAGGFWEREAVLERAKIRLDLLLIWPILFCVTGIALLLSVQSLLRARRCNQLK